MLICQASTIFNTPLQDDSGEDLRLNRDGSGAPDKTRHSEPLNLVLHTRHPQIADHCASMHEQAACAERWSPETVYPTMQGFNSARNEWRSPNSRVSSPGDQPLVEQRWSSEKMASAIRDYLSAEEEAARNEKWLSINQDRTDSCRVIENQGRRWSSTSSNGVQDWSPVPAATAEEDHYPGRESGTAINGWSAKAVFSPMHNEKQAENLKQRWSREKMTSAIQNYLSEEQRWSPNTGDCTTQQLVDMASTDEWSSVQGYTSGQESMTRSEGWSPNTMSSEMQDTTLHQDAQLVAGEWSSTTGARITQDKSSGQELACRKEWSPHSVVSPQMWPQTASAPLVTDYSRQESTSPENVPPVLQGQTTGHQNPVGNNRWCHKNSADDTAQAIALVKEPQNFTERLSPKTSDSPSGRHYCPFCNCLSAEQQGNAKHCSGSPSCLCINAFTSTLDTKNEVRKHRKRKFVNKYKDKNSYCAEIARILLEKGCLPLARIYEVYEHWGLHIKRPSAHSWKNSIRHNLSLHECFIKIPTIGQGFNRWAVHPNWVPHFQCLTARLPSKGPLIAETTVEVTENTDVNKDKAPEVNDATTDDVTHETDVDDRIDDT